VGFFSAPIPEQPAITETRHIKQTQRRVVHGETVAARDKVVYIFETHTDVIVKDRRETIFGQKICLSGGASNLKQAKALGMKDVCFAKKPDLEETQMCRSEYVYHRLRRFRDGIESGISWLKRSLGLSRCTWKGWHAFKC
jgi:IS5 family transposase